MPANTIPYGRITTVPSPANHRRYFTWLPGHPGEVVTVRRHTIDRVVVVAADNVERRFTHAGRRKWAPLNPAPIIGQHYVTVEDANVSQNSELDCGAGEVIHWDRGMSTGNSYEFGHYIARVPARERSMYVKSFVMLEPTRVPQADLRNVGEMPSGNVRVVYSSRASLVGTITTASDAYRQDSNATGVYLGTDSRPGHSQARPDPGPGPYVTRTEVPRREIHSLASMAGNGTTVTRVIRSALPALIGQVGDSWTLYLQDSGAEGVIVSAESERDVARIAADPGPGPYLAQSRLRAGVEMVYVGDDEDVRWSNPTWVEVVSTSSSYRGVECYAQGDMRASYQYVREGDLVPAAGYVDTREPCERCGIQRCRCVACTACNEQVDPNGSLARRNTNGYVYHDACVSRCTRCSNYSPTDSMVPASEVEGGDGDIMADATYCPSCVRSCRNCGGVRRLVSPATYCRSCRMQREDAVRSYGHTVPDMWLGGPLPKNKAGHHVGFYIGFELEVSSADLSNIRPLRQWSEAHLGNRRAIDPKRDGSVAGFEIATQPMTPEFFEQVDWDSFFEVLDQSHRTQDASVSREPVGHGLHVHIGRIAFERDDIATAMFTYLLAQGDHLERIGRRAPTGYCEKVRKPASTALYERFNRTGLGRSQAERIRRSGGLSGRAAINLGNDQTIEIRAFRSTRNAEHLKAAVRVVYLAARYIAYLRGEVKAFVSPKALHWDSFITWVQDVMPEAVTGLTEPFVEVLEGGDESDYEDDDGYDEEEMGPDYDEDDEDEDPVIRIATPAYVTLAEPINAVRRLSEQVATFQTTINAMRWDGDITF